MVESISNHGRGCMLHMRSAETCDRVLQWWTSRYCSPSWFVTDLAMICTGQVHWLRLVLDEGHTLGALAATNKMTCAVNLRAERRCA